jgi:hypothetical protein
MRVRDRAIQRCVSYHRSSLIRCATTCFASTNRVAFHKRGLLYAEIFATESLPIPTRMAGDRGRLTAQAGGLLRPVPGNTVIHQLLAGTKLVVVDGIVVCSRSTQAGCRSGSSQHWCGPRWLWILLIRGGVTATLAGGAAPSFHMDSVDTGLGGPAPLPASHGAVDRAARPRAMVVDHQCCRNRARRSDIGPTGAALRIPIDKRVVTIGVAWLCGARTSWRRDRRARRGEPDLGGAVADQQD